MSDARAPALWQFDETCAVVVHVEGTMFRLDKDPMPNLNERDAALALAVLRVAGARLERQVYPERQVKP